MFLPCILHAALAQAPLPGPRSPNPISMALLLGTPLLGSDHSGNASPEHVARYAPGLALRMELGWGAPDVRGAVVVSAVDTWLFAPENWRSQHIDIAITAQVNGPVAELGDWQLRILVEGGLGLSSPMMSFPSLRAGVAVRAQRSTGSSRPLVELRSTGALGAVFIEQAVSKSGGIYTATGWQISLHLGMEFGPAY